MNRLRTHASSDAGSVTLWGIGLALVLLGFGGVVIDGWRAFAERQDVAGMADAAAIAGATAIDEAQFRATGEARLDPAQAEARAREYLLRQDNFDPGAVTASIRATSAGVEVVLEKDVNFTLLGLFLAGDEPLRIRVPGYATPNLVAP